MIYTTLFTAALAISGTAVASPMKNNHNHLPPNSGAGIPPKKHSNFPPNSVADVVPPKENNDLPPSGDTDAPPAFDGKYTSLKGWAKGHGRYWGTAVDPPILKNTAMADFIAKEFNQVTPENSMKWAETEPHPGKFDFAAADEVVKFAQKHGMEIRGHCLLWHKQAPAWVYQIKDPDEMAEAIRRHITAVVGRYKGIIKDVVNEIFEQDGSFRHSVFYRLLGEKFVHIAFEAANKADSDAALYINDFNLDAPNAPKTLAMIAKVKGWRNANVAITGIGSQSHIEQGGGKRHAAALKAMSAVVPEVAITELDIPNAPSQDYVDVVKGCLVLKNCVGITSWGACDKVSWLPGKSPLLFDGQMRPKEAYKAIMSSL
ncbi:Endo-1,4-beta-xylanase 2 [Epichloe bromicola]|uniref:Beta-xylanase n=1 Tax=Epichloe bromicola TaxID=79588 RepID=A0ABQ0CUP2_9HYPO